MSTHFFQCFTLKREFIRKETMHEDHNYCGHFINDVHTLLS